MRRGQEQAWAAGSRHSAGNLADALRANSARRGDRSDLVDAQSHQQEELLDDYAQLIKAALDHIPEHSRSEVRQLWDFMQQVVLLLGVTSDIHPGRI